jgi:hypothetical protein
MTEATGSLSVVRPTIVMYRVTRRIWQRHWRVRATEVAFDEAPFRNSVVVRGG